MTTVTVLSMIFILGLVVGGFLYFLFLAIRKEKQNSSK